MGRRGPSRLLIRTGSVYTVGGKRGAGPSSFSVTVWRYRPLMGRRDPSRLLISTRFVQAANFFPSILLRQRLAESTSDGTLRSAEAANLDTNPYTLTEESGAPGPHFLIHSLCQFLAISALMGSRDPSRPLILFPRCTDSHDAIIKCVMCSGAFLASRNDAKRKRSEGQVRLNITRASRPQK